jgi:hypothetical protein
VFEVVVRDPDALGTVWLPTGHGVDDVKTVEPEMRVASQRPAVGARGTAFPGFTELRPVDAVRAAPWAARSCLPGGRKRVG